MGYHIDLLFNSPHSNPNTYQGLNLIVHLRNTVTQSRKRRYKLKSKGVGQKNLKKFADVFYGQCFSMGIATDSCFISKFHVLKI